MLLLQYKCLCPHAAMDGAAKSKLPPQLLTPVPLFTYLSVLYLDPPSIHKKLQKFPKNNGYTTVYQIFQAVEGRGSLNIFMDIFDT